MKQFFFIVSIVCLSLSLIGCGSSNTSSSENVLEKKPTQNQEEDLSNNGNRGIVAGKIEPSVANLSGEGSKISFTYELKNQTEKVVELSFNTSQKFDYVLKDQSGKVIKFYSENKDFLQVISKISLKQGEVYKIPITIEDVKPGKYLLEVWLTSDHKNNYLVTAPIEVKN
jgi:hypothetical protein